MGKRRGQVSVEYLLILAFVFAILIPGIFFFYTYSRSSASGVEASQYAKLGQQMLSTALQTAAQGESSWLTLDVTIPESVTNISVEHNGSELVISFSTAAGITQAVFFSEKRLCPDSQDPDAECPGSTADGSVFQAVPHGGRATFRFTSGRSAVGIKEKYE